MRRFLFNTDTLSYVEQRRSKWRRALESVAIAVAAVAVVAAFCWLWFVVLGKDLPKTALLKRRNDLWQARMGVIRHKLDVYDQTLSGIEARDNQVYRSIFALDAIADTVRNDTASNRMQALDFRLDAFQRRIDLQMSALGEVALVAKKAGDMVSCIPAVPPVLPKKGTYHLSSPFGTREDPVYGGMARHTGQDIASHIGNPVYATGDGVVEKVDFKYSGYGNEVVIDHGFGYKTRYAHLKEIKVTQGQVVIRGDRIGTLGSSGLSTGPHLHYEVIYRGTQINPWNFLNPDVTPEEYNKLVRGNG